jgi:hypothetical protein
MPPIRQLDREPVCYSAEEPLGGVFLLEINALEISEWRWQGFECLILRGAKEGGLTRLLRAVATSSYTC